MFEDIKHELSLILVLRLTDPGRLKQSKYTDDDIYTTKFLALEKVHRQRI